MASVRGNPIQSIGGVGFDNHEMIIGGDGSWNYSVHSGRGTWRVKQVMIQ